MRFIELFAGIGGFRYGFELVYDLHEAKEHEHEAEGCAGSLKRGVEPQPTTRLGHLLVSGPTKSTSMHVKYTGSNSEPKNSTKETSMKSEQKVFPTTTYLWGDFLANLSVLLESEKDSMILGELCSSKYAGLRKPNGLSYYCLRTSKGYSITKGGKLSEQSSPRLMNWGTMRNGKCLTAKISESPKTGSECSLSDILEEKVADKYFLSQEQVERIAKWKYSETPHDRSVRL